MATTALGLAGILRERERAPVSTEAMNEAIEQTAAELISGEKPSA